MSERKREFPGIVCGRRSYAKALCLGGREDIKCPHNISMGAAPMGSEEDPDPTTSDRLNRRTTLWNVLSYTEAKVDVTQEIEQRA